MKKVLLIAAALTIFFGASAQPEGHHKACAGTPEEKAKCIVDKMKADLPLTDKQVKKLNKHFVKDIKYREEHAAAQRPPMGPGSGPDFKPEEGHQHPHGVKPDEHPGHGHGHGPGFGPGHGGPGMGPGPRPNPADAPDFEAMAKYNKKQEKKLKKILGDDLYAQWREKQAKCKPCGEEK